MLNLAGLAFLLLGLGLFLTPRRRLAGPLVGLGAAFLLLVVQLTFAEKLAPGAQTVFVPSTENFLLDLRGLAQGQPAR